MRVRHLHRVAVAVIAIVASALSNSALASGPAAQALKGHTSRVTAVAFSRDGQVLASGSVDATIRLWDVKSGAMLTPLNGHRGVVSALAFSPDAKTLASGSNVGEVVLWDLATGQVPATLLGHTGKVRCVAFSPDGAWMATGSADKTVRLWNAKTHEFKATLAGHARGVLCVAFSPDGKSLASGSADENVKIWSVDRGCEQPGVPLGARHKHGAIVSVAFAPDGADLAIVTAESVEVWELAQAKRRFVLQHEQKGATWWSACYSTQGTLFAIGSGVKYAHTVHVNTKQGVTTGSYQANDHEISIWDATTGKELRRLKGHHDAVRTLDLSSDGARLASGGTDKVVLLWDVARWLKPTDEPPAIEPTAATGSEMPAPLNDGLQEDKLADPSRDTALTEGEINNPHIFPLALLEPIQVDCFPAADANADDSSVSDVVVWLCGRGSLSDWSDIRLTVGKGGKEPGHVTSGKGGTGKTPAESGDRVRADEVSPALMRFSSDHGTSSWLGSHANFQPIVSRATDSTSGSRSDSRSGGDSSSHRGSKSDGGHGQRAEGFWSRAGKSIGSGIRAVGESGGGGGGSHGGHEGHGGGDHKDKK